MFVTKLVKTDIRITPEAIFGHQVTIIIISHGLLLIFQIIFTNSIDEMKINKQKTIQFIQIF